MGEEKIIPKLTWAGLNQEALTTFKSKLDELDNGSTVLLFIGNGISSKKLSSEQLIKDFFYDIKNNHPIKFKELNKTNNSFFNLIHCTEGSEKKEYDLFNFMDNFTKMKILKEDFLGYVIKTCCNASPNINHYLILLLVTLIRSYKDKNFKIIIFTTNYDNLLLKDYEDKHELISQINNGQIKKIPISIQGEKGEQFFRLKDDSLKETIKKFNKPDYVLDENGIKNSEFPIVPIHGSIIVCKCPSKRCGRVLKTEGSAKNIKWCTFCGAQIQPIILPTSEAEVEKEILDIFENQVKKAHMILSFGFSFNDPHIVNRIAEGIKNSQSLKGSSNKIIISCVNSEIEESVRKELPKDVYEVRDDITHSMVTLLHAFDKEIEFTNELSFEEKMVLHKFGFIEKIFKERIKNE